MTDHVYAPAVRRAAMELPLVRLALGYRILAAALDVEEMARPLCRRIHRSLWPIEPNPSTRKPCANCVEHMAIVRTSVLGEP